MEKIPPFGEEPTKEILVSLDAGEKVDVPIKKIEKKPSGLLNKIRRVIGVGAVAAAALGGEACSPNIRPENPTTRPALSAIGNMMRFRNLSLTLPRSLRLATPDSIISCSENFFSLR